MRIARHALFVAFVLGCSLAAAAQVSAIEIRSATDAEITTALMDCWTQEQTIEGLRAERRKMFYQGTICFEPEGRLLTFRSTWSYGVFRGLIHGFEFGLGAHGSEGGGTFEVTDGKLRLYGTSFDGWIFPTETITCDVLMDLGRAFKLLNCVGSGSSWGVLPDGENPLPDTSYFVQ